jgi:hypothetical protein
MNISTDFRTYQDCINNMCSYLKEEPDELAECISDIKQQYNDPNLCSTEVSESSCEIIHSEQFKNLLIFLIFFFKFQYCSRSFYGNKNDRSIITTLGNLDLSDFGLTIDELSCVKLQDFVAPKMPKNLADYFRVMREISKSGDNYVAKVETNSVLKQFEDFVSDYQPWSRLLSTGRQAYGHQSF